MPRWVRQGCTYSNPSTNSAIRPIISSTCAFSNISGGDSAMMSPVARTSIPTAWPNLKPPPAPEPALHRCLVWAAR